MALYTSALAYISCRPPRQLSLRRVFNAILHVLKTGCQWRQLPHEFPVWSAAYYRWSRDGAWPGLHGLLRARSRQKQGRHKRPTAGCLDSQSVKGTATPGERGYDAGKKIDGRKRHLLVGTLGLLLAVVVTTADVQDRDGARLLLKNLPGSCKKLRKIWVDGGYSGQLLGWVVGRFKFCLAVVLCPKECRQFTLLPRRWVAERALAWPNHNRRLSKSYERLTRADEAWVYIAMTRIMLARLA
jgi:putative transposase